MGIYLYGIRKLKRPQTVTREDGRVLRVEHCLSFVSKPYYDLGGTTDRYTRLAMGRIERSYGANFRGPVLFGSSIIEWDGSPMWWDCDDFPKGCSTWGEALDLCEASDSKDDHLATLSLARLPSLRVVEVTDRSAEGRPPRIVTHTLEDRVMVQDHQHRVVAERTCYAVRLPTGAVAMRGAQRRLDEGQVLLPPGASDQEIQAQFRAYVAVCRDYLLETTYVAPPPVAAPKPPPPAVVAPTHEECLRAAGWI